MHEELWWQFIAAGIAGAKYYSTSKHLAGAKMKEKMKESGQIDTITGLVLIAAIIGITILQVTDHDIPGIFQSVIISVLGGSVGAEVVAAAKDKIKKKKDDPPRE